MKQNYFSKSLTDFLTKYLPAERGMSYNTIASYKITFILLLSFMQEQKGVEAQKLMFKHLTRNALNIF